MKYYSYSYILGKSNSCYPCMNYNFNDIRNDHTEFMRELESEGYVFDYVDNLGCHYVRNDIFGKEAALIVTLAIPMN